MSGVVARGVAFGRMAAAGSIELEDALAGARMIPGAADRVCFVSAVFLGCRGAS